MKDKTDQELKEEINKVLYQTHGDIRKILLEELDREKADRIYNRIVLEA